MDCCNYVPYRQQHGYYGYYNELLPPYHGDFYGHHNMYHDYYGNINPYYSPHHWQGGSVFGPQDYVYNPKEARLRKAMREAASRDRSIGASPMLPRPNARRAGPAAGWGTPGAAVVGAAGSITPAPHGPLEEPLMMSPLNQSIRGPGLDSPCYPIGGSGNEQFMPPSMGPTTGPPAVGYTAKMHQDSPLPPPSASTPGVPPPYMQTNPLTQLQQQTEMWHNFQDDMRPRSSSNPYMIQEMQSPYHHHQPSPPLSIPSPLMMDQHRQTPSHSIHPMNTISMPMTPPHSNSIMSMTPPHSNENVPPDESLQMNQAVIPDEEPKHTMDIAQPLMENNLQRQNQNEYETDMYGTNVGLTNQPHNRGQQFEKQEDVKGKKSNTPVSPPRTASFSSASKKPSPKPLPDFNEAFGSTERGRFQSPPDPRLGPNKGYLDLFCEDGPPLKFDDFHI